MVLVPLDHPHGPVDKRGVPLGLVGKETALPVRFEVRFVDQVQAVLVAQLIPARVVGIV